MYCASDDVLFDSSPSGVNRCCRSGFAVADEDGDAVSYSNSASDGAVSGNDGVSLKSESHASALGVVDDVALSAVDLREAHDVFWFDTEVFCGDCKVFFHVVGVVAGFCSEVERVERGGTYSAFACEECVSKPGCG